MLKSPILEDYSYVATIATAFITLAGICVAYYIAEKELDERKKDVTMKAWTEFTNNTQEKEMVSIYRLLVHKPYNIESLFFNDEKIMFYISRYLNELEIFAYCVNEKIYNFEVIRHLSSGRIKSLYDLFYGVIKELRRIHDNDNIYSEFEKLVENIQKH